MCLRTRRRLLLPLGVPGVGERGSQCWPHLRCWCCFVRWCSRRTPCRRGRCHPRCHPETASSSPRTANSSAAIWSCSSPTRQRIGDFLGIRPNERVYVKRVIGLPGERLTVDEAGTLRIDDVVVQEPYLAPGVLASTTPLRIRVPPGRYFVMGDNRPASDDSRNHLGDPGGGSVRAADVIGEVVWRYWPKSGWGSVDDE